MTEEKITNPKPSDELEILKRHVAELEALVSQEHADKKLTQLEDEGLYKAIFESANDSILLIDKKGTIIDFNNRLLEIGGYEREELVGKNIRSIAGMVTKESLVIIVRNFLKRMSGVSISPYEIELVKKNGEIVIVEINVRPLKKEGKITGGLAILRDITNRKKAEEAMKITEQNLQNSLDNLSMGFRITDVDDNTLYLNKAFLDIFGYENIDEVRRKPPLKDFYTQESYASYLLRKQKLVRGEPREDHVEVDIVRKDGVLRHLQLSTGELVWNGKKQFQTLYNDITELKQAEEALRLSEQNFHNSLDSSSMGINIVDSDNKTLYANQALMDIFGYKNIDDLRAKPPHSFYTHASYVDYVARNRLILSGKPVPDSVEVDIIRTDNTTRHLQVFRGVVFWDGKRRYQSLYHDITEQKQIETALRESEEKYRTIFESANDVLILLDTNGKILDVNARLTDIGGYGRYELIGKNLIELTNIIDHENLSIALANFRKTTDGHGIVSYQLEMIKKNREPIHLEIHGIPIKKDEKVIGVLAILRDITERNKSELLVKEQKALTDRILESTPNAVVVVGKDRQVIKVNKAFERTFQLAKDKVEGKEIGEIIPVPRVIEAIMQALGSNMSQYPIEFRYKIGTQEKVLIGHVIIMQENEVLAHFEDVTEEREIQGRLYLTDRLASLGEMAAGIAHEINNPLTGVVALSQLLLESSVPPEIKDDLEAISSEGQRAASIVRNLLSFARSHTISAQPVEINSIIDQVLKLRAYEHRVNNIEVVTHLASNLPEIVADRFQMQQVFLNIVLNAEQAMIESHNRGSLTVTTERIEGNIKISFADNGPGIPQDIINRIFDPFFTTKEVGKGTGLGLSICYGIVSKQGGRIYAESQLGQGATFIVELPIVAH